MSELKFGNNLSSIKFGNNRKVIFFTDPGKLSDWRYSTATNGQITLYEYTAGDWANTVYVPIAGGKTLINNYRLGTTTTFSNTPFYNNPNVVSVDLQSVPFVSNSMHRAFYNCRNLTSVNNINPSVTNMANTFYYCNHLNQNIQIPNSVTSMGGTFWGCHNLNQNIQIPNSVTNMSTTFEFCYNLNQNIQIPNSVTNMANTFYYCNHLNQNIQIPNSVTSMGGTFWGCDNLNQNIQIPNSVTSMSSTFSYCYNLNQNIKIPNSVTNMAGTFSYCYNLQGTINMLSNQITNASNCFYGTSRAKNVYIPFKYSNGVNSATFSSFVSAGYLYANGVSNNQHGVTVYDLNSTGGNERSWNRLG